MAKEIFEDPNHVVLDNYLIAEVGEQRMQAIGVPRELILLVVIFVDRSENARKATVYQRNTYSDQFA
jgi:uncharacterized DUF497 family protein